MGRFILTQNYKRLMNGESQSFGSSSSYYACYRVHDINEVSDDNWIARTIDGTKKKVHRTPSSNSGATAAINEMGNIKSNILSMGALDRSLIYFGTGGSLLDENSYTADESLGYATTLTPVYTPSPNRLVITYTNATSASVSFDQIHCIISAYLTDTLQTTSITSSKVMYWAYDFGETITVAAGETVTINIKLW